MIILKLNVTEIVTEKTLKSPILHKNKPRWQTRWDSPPIIKARIIANRLITEHMNNTLGKFKEMTPEQVRTLVFKSSNKFSELDPMPTG